MESTLGAVEVRQSVEAVYRADADRLWRALLAWSGDADVASDAVAEAYAQLLRRGSDVRDPVAWTWSAAFRIAAGVLKERNVENRRRAPEDSLEAAARTSPADDNPVDPDMLEALQRLPPGQRAAVVLFYYADLPIREIAGRLGSNGLAVRANLSRGRRRLRELLGERHG